jgi:uncharacterized protein YqeY
MSLLDNLNSDLKEALRNRDGERADLIRNLKSDLKYREIDKKAPLSDDDMVAVLSSAAKKRREAIEQFQAGGRDDLVQRETRQLDLINGYLPQQLSEEELAEVVEGVISEIGAVGPADLGKVMRELMPKVRGRADGSIVKQIVAARLAGQN